MACLIVYILLLLVHCFVVAIVCVYVCVWGLCVILWFDMCSVIVAFPGNIHLILWIKKGTKCKKLALDLIFLVRVHFF